MSTDKLDTLTRQDLQLIIDALNTHYMSPDVNEVTEIKIDSLKSKLVDFRNSYFTVIFLEPK